VAEDGFDKIGRKMAQLYVLGGKQRQLALKKEEEWNLYESALILKVDTETGTAKVCVEYKTPAAARAHKDSSSVFKSGTIVGDNLYACTNTEVLVYKLPDFEIVNYISLPCFNDVHHVTPSRDGSLLVVSTGLDLVVRLTPKGEILHEWSTLAEPPWQQFSRSVDYRKVASTKPHRSHPNFAFEVGSDVWATRFQQRDAICLAAPGRRIDIAVERPHDGLVHGGQIYFTTVDGRIAIANADSLLIDKMIDLTSIDDPDALLGWCRGILPLGDEKFWVGFTRVRKTRILENILWVKSVFKEGMIEKPTHITLYDLARGKRLQEFDLEAYGMNIVFSIFPVNE
jgi:hypothetical protein